MTSELDPHAWLASDAIDSGCAASFEVLHLFVETELSGVDPGRTLPGVAAHVRRCPACRADYLGLLEALQLFGDAVPAVPLSSE